MTISEYTTSLSSRCVILSEAQPVKEFRCVILSERSESKDLRLSLIKGFLMAEFSA
jgi:hypothetical protein